MPPEDDFEREDKDKLEMRTWEAGLATAAAPFYFPEYYKPETKKDYVDGALHANFPGAYALEEMDKILYGPSHASMLLSMCWFRLARVCNTEMSVFPLL